MKDASASYIQDVLKCIRADMVSQTDVDTGHVRRAVQQTKNTSKKNKYCSNELSLYHTSLT